MTAFSLTLRSIPIAILFSWANAWGQGASSFLTKRADLLQQVEEKIDEPGRSGVWALSQAAVARFGPEFPMHEVFDPRQDLHYSSVVAERYWLHLHSLWKDSGWADHAFVYGPAVSRRLQESDVQLPMLEVDNKVSFEQLDKLQAYAGELMVEGPLYWEDLAATTFRDPQDFFAANPSVSLDRLPSGAKAWLRLERFPESSDLSAVVQKALLRDSIQAAEVRLALEKRRKGIPDPATHDAEVYKVKSGDYLGRIASVHGLRVRDIQKWNSLKGDRIRIGQELLLYLRKDRKKPEAAEVVDSSPPAQQIDPREKDREAKYYEIKSGDTLWSIAQSYPGVSADDLMRWNGIDERIQEGQVILLLPPKDPSSN